jgi:hypothetical protein
MQGHPSLIFVYNADSGIYNSLVDIAHRIFSPGTYACNLCAITYSTTGKNRQWVRFLTGLGIPFEFLHRDEFKKQYGVDGIKLPAIFKEETDGLAIWIDADSINSCRNVNGLIRLISERLNSKNYKHRSIDHD